MADASTDAGAAKNANTAARPRRPARAGQSVPLELLAEQDVQVRHLRSVQWLERLALRVTEYCDLVLSCVSPGAGNDNVAANEKRPIRRVEAVQGGELVERRGPIVRPLHDDVHQRRRRRTSGPWKQSGRDQAAGTGQEPAARDGVFYTTTLLFTTRTFNGRLFALFAPSTSSWVMRETASELSRRHAPNGCHPQGVP
jgi:hypothetical protein